jgi:hypothetical protein
VRVQTFIQTDRQQVQPHTLGVRVMLLTDVAEGRTGQRLAALGSVIDVADDLAEQAISTLIAGAAKMRVMLVSREFDVPAYPLGRRTAVCLPEDVSDTSFRIGFDHVLRDRAALTMN